MYHVRAKKQRRFSYDFTWYDGPHYSFQLWFFGITLSSGWKVWQTREAFENIMRKILDKKLEL